MGVTWGSSSQRRAGVRRATGSSGSAALLSPPRFLSNRGVISRWLRASASLGSSQRVPFASPSPTPSTAAGGDALTYPAQMAALGRVVASTRGVLAAQAHVAAHNAARSPNP